MKGIIMEIFENINGTSSVNAVYYATLKDGRVAIKYDPSKKFFKVVSADKFKSLCDDAKVIVKEVNELKFNQ